MGRLSPRQWRHLEHQARRAEDEEALSAVTRLAGVLDGILESPAPGVVRLRGTTWQVAVGGASVPSALQGARCRLGAAGRYGRWWWVRLLTANGTSTVLGSHLRVMPVWGGGKDGMVDSPAGGEWILVSCEYGSPSVTSPG